MNVTDLRALAVVLVTQVLIVSGGFAHPAWEVVIGSLAALSLFALLRAGGRPLPTDQALILCLIGIGVVATIHRGAAISEARRVVGVWIVAWILWQLARAASSIGRRMIRITLLCGALILALAVVLEWSVTRLPGVGGLLLNPNDTAAILVPTLGLLLAAAVGARRRIWLTLPALLLVFGAVLTGSRAALLALLMLMVAVLPRGRRRTQLVVVGVLLAVVLVAWRFAVSPDTLAWHRWSIWAAVSELAIQRPLLGWGPGGLVDITGVVRLSHVGSLAHHLHRIGSAESSVLGVVIRLGGVGLLVALMAAVGWWRRVGHRGSTAEIMGRRAAAVAVMAVVLVHDQLEVPLVLWSWALILGAFEPEVKAQPRLNRRPWPWLSSLAAAALVAGTVVHPALVQWWWLQAPSSVDSVWTAQRGDRFNLAPVSWRLNDLLGQSRWTWDEAAEALFWSDRAVAIDNGKAALWAENGRVRTRILRQHGAWSDVVGGAREAFARATELEPRLPWAWFDWAQHERAVGDLEEARRHARRSVEVEPNFVRGWLLLARLDFDLGRHGQALQSLGKARLSRRQRFSAFTGYERELVDTPRWQLQQLELLLR